MGATSGAGGNILLLGAVDGNVAATRTLTLTAGTGDVTVGGAIGATNSLSALTITGNDISLASIGGASAGVSGATSVTAADFGVDIGSIQTSGVIRTTGSQTYGGTGITSIGGDLIAANNSITVNNAAVTSANATVDTGTATATFSSTLNIGANTFVISADEISFGATVSGIGGMLTLQQGTTGAQMQIGSPATAANRLDLTPAKLVLLQSGFSSITFGRTDSAAAVNVNAVSFSNSTTIATGSGLLTIAGAVTSSADLRLESGTGGISIDGAVNVGANDLGLSSNGSVTQSAQVVASGLELLGTATFDLSLPTNDVDTLAADISGSLTFNDADDLIVGSVGSSTGILTGNPASGGNVTIAAAGILTVNEVIDTSSGLGGVLTTAGNVVVNTSVILGSGNISLTGNNQTPINTVPVSQTTNEDTPLVFSSGNGNLISIADPDAASNPLEVTLTASLGLLSLNGTTGLTFSSGTGTGDASMTFTGSLANIKTAFNGLTFTPTANANGAASLSITTSDQGYTGLGGVLSDIDTVNITVTSVNDGPAGADQTVTTLEDTAYTFTASDFGFSDASDSPANSLLAVTISTLPGAGALTLSGVAVTLGQSISLADISAGNLVFTPGANANGTAYASFTFQVQDNGGTASGGVNLDPTANTITLDVTSVNDGPVRTAGTVSDLTVAEDSGVTSLGLTNFFYNPGGGADESGQTLVFTVTGVPSASLGAIVLADGMTIVTSGTSYTLAELQGMQFRTAWNANGGPEVLRWTVQDGAGTANGGVDLLTESLSIRVVMVNDAPTAVPSQFFVANNGILAVGSPGVLVGANDLDGDPLTAILVQGPAAGQLLLNSDGSFTYVPDVNVADQMHFSFVAYDGVANSAVTNVTINITAAVGALPSEDPSNTGTREIDRSFATLSPESLPSGQAVQDVQTNGPTSKIPRELEWHHGNEVGYSHGEPPGVRANGVSREFAEAYVANGSQDDLAQYATRLSPSPTQLPTLLPGTDDVIGTVEGGRMLPHQDGGPESEQEADGFCRFIVRATAAVPITMSVGYAIWMLSEKSIVPHRSLAMAQRIDPLEILNVFTESRAPLPRESEFDRRPVKWIHDT